MAHDSIIKSTSHSAISWGSPRPSQLAATAKKPGHKEKASEDAPKVSALIDELILAHTHIFHIHTITPETQMAKVTKV